MSVFCQINQKCKKLNQKAAAGKSVCVIFLQHPLYAEHNLNKTTIVIEFQFTLWPIDGKLVFGGGKFNSTIE